MNIARLLPASPILIAILTGALVSGCNLPPGLASGLSGGNPGNSSGSPGPAPEPAGNPAPNDTDSTGSSLCKTSDPESQCIGLRIVSYDEGSKTVLPYSDALALVTELNRVWSPCKIGFDLASYEHVDPFTRGLSLNPNWRSEGSQIRAAFNDQVNFLVVAVGRFAASTIAVTQMPGYGPFGTLVESAYATNPLTVGHELGHYMGLYHIRNTSNLMNPYIGPHTEQLSESQCSIARSTNARFWANLLK
jgi:hypothetical protein